MRNSLMNYACIFAAMFSLLAAKDDQSGFNQFVGSWEGEGRFYNTSFNNEYGRVAFQINIDEDYSISGMVGGARIAEAEMAVDSWNEGYKIEARLQNKIFPGKDYHKDCVVFLLKEPIENQIHGDFHVMGNFIFDFGMRPGAINLVRTP